MLITPGSKRRTYQAAPTTDREIASPIPREAHMKGDVSSKNLLNDKGFKLKTVLLSLSQAQVYSRKNWIQLNPFNKFNWVRQTNYHLD